MSFYRNLDSNYSNDKLFPKIEQFYEKYIKFNGSRSVYRIFKLITENKQNDN